MSDVRELKQLDRCVLKTRPVRTVGRMMKEYREVIFGLVSLFDLMVQGPYIRRPWEIMGRKLALTGSDRHICGCKLLLYKGSKMSLH
jgi:hypothetical protein